jgi:hypothetical protein
LARLLPEPTLGRGPGDVIAEYFARQEGTARRRFSASVRRRCLSRRPCVGRCTGPASTIGHLGGSGHFADPALIAPSLWIRALSTRKRPACSVDGERGTGPARRFGTIGFLPMKPSWLEEQIVHTSVRSAARRSSGAIDSADGRRPPHQRARQRPSDPCPEARRRAGALRSPSGLAWTTTKAYVSCEACRAEIEKRLVARR